MKNMLRMEGCLLLFVVALSLAMLVSCGKKKTEPAAAKAQSCPTCPAKLPAPSAPLKNSAGESIELK